MSDPNPPIIQSRRFSELSGIDLSQIPTLNFKLLTPAKPIEGAIVLRKEDFLCLTFVFNNLGLSDDSGGRPTLVQLDTKKKSYVTVYFPQQSIGEEAFYRTTAGVVSVPPAPSSGDSPLGLPAESRIGSFSWLAFEFPTKTPVPYTLESLLDWGRWKLLVSELPEVDALWRQLWKQVAGFDPPAKMPMPPSPLRTAIEAPHRLVLSPTVGARWEHKTELVGADGRFELWHTRLSDTGARQVSAIWARDFSLRNLPLSEDDKKKVPDQAFGSSFVFAPLNTRQRTELVLLSSTEAGKPATAEQLMLTPLGAYLKVRGAWTDKERGDVLPLLGLNGTLGVSEWRHEMTLGREHYARIVEEGLLFPFGHRAALVTVTQRAFEGGAAPLQQRMYILVRQPVRNFASLAAETRTKKNQQARLLMPFRQITLTTSITGILDPLAGPEAQGVIFPTSSGNPNAFWVRSGKQEVPFKCVALDWEGNTFDFTLPLIFVGAATAKSPASVEALVNAYVNNPKESLRRVAAGGRMIAFAKPGVGHPGETSYETAGILLGAEQLSAPPEGVPLFCASMQKADVRLAAVEHLGAGAGGARIQYADVYLKDEFGGENKGGLLAVLTPDSAAPSLNFAGQAQKSGGLATPNLTPKGLARDYGVVSGDPNQFAAGAFNPWEYFDQAKLLGSISLGDLIDGDQVAPGSIPQIVTAPLPATPGAEPDAVETKLVWAPRVKDSGFLKFRGQPPGNNLKLNVLTRTDLRGGSSTRVIEGRLTDFDIELFGVVKISFAEVIFRQPAGEKMDVHVGLADDPVGFAGPLGYLNDLAQFIRPKDFADPPSVDVDASGVRVGYGLGLPDLTVGAYALQNIKFSAALNLPFTDDPVRLRLAFCERHDPFLVTVSAVAGGGFVALSLGPDGLESVEASLEFGGNIAFNVGVASGGVCVMGGFHVATQENSTTFGAYVRAAGVVEVLELICVSLELYLGLDFSKAGGRRSLWGQAKATVEVEVLFFSESVSITYEREFAGSAGDPTFRDLTTLDDWKTYLAAFAA